MAEGETHIPFAIARTYWTYDVPGGESRGGHAHKECQEFIIAASGSFSVTLDNGEQKKTYHLNHPWEGLFVDVNIWRTLDDFSSGSHLNTMFAICGFVEVSNYLSQQSTALDPII